MKVCAHMNLGPYQNAHFRADSTSEAIEFFKNSLVSIYGNTKNAYTDNQEPPVMDIYQQCDDCDAMMNFHDYPMTRYEVGKFGGIKKVSV